MPLVSLTLACFISVFVPAIAKTVEVDINPSESVLFYRLTMNDLQLGTDIASNNYVIKGKIVVDKGSLSNNIYVSVSPLTLFLSSEGDTIKVAISGTIGGSPPSATLTPVRFTGKQASVDLTGDLDESTISLTTWAGRYTSNTLVITAILL